ncbi:RelA/SpoT family protein [Eubacterium xylanophilum]|uniref:RelA/SpoT family protein n=1 Tax=Eubacterium xylanophilum TaxID=39497 RepID=UPI000554666E|nr:bifunctional (p)ppGpp synthetase/guanosine-3',5'-bis(diphosphate) 3'-pyrophosphohydrolase [Eubacterium xylanophilum]
MSKGSELIEQFDTGALSTDIIPPSFTDPDVLFEVLKKIIESDRPDIDMDMVARAYELAKKAHKGQKRKSGEPYLIHPVCVAIILTQIQMDTEAIVGGLLHDVIEDTEFSEQDIVEMFSKEIAILVEGVTKLTQLNYSADKLDVQAENLRKMFLAMAKDIRVIIIKLADRLHNMRTLEFMKPEKQKEKARETMDIYAPLADRLGISKVKVELDDLSLKYLEPEAYKDLSEKFNNLRDKKEVFVKDIMARVKDTLEIEGISAIVDGRVKHLFSIYRKMLNQNKTLDQIYDLFAIRIIVDTEQQCYTALGIIHEMYKPIPGRFKDYIAMPKSNHYQSLHTTLIAPSGQPFEIQIRTREMHKIAEYGIAAHWKYKETNKSSKVEGDDEKIAWLRQILEWNNDMSDNKEFLSLIKSDLNLFADSVYCFTPEGDVKTLTAGSTPIDFAYSIHSAVGNKMVGARVNGNIVKLDYVIQNGDRVEIVTSQNSKGPSRDWLKVVKTTQAKNKINQWFRSEFKEENITKGKELLYQYAKTKGIDLSILLKPEYTGPCKRKYGFNDWDSVCAAIGHGGLREGQIINKLQYEYDKRNNKVVNEADVLKAIEKVNESNKKSEARHTNAKNKGSIVVEGLDDIAVRFSRCCNPVPGDEIVGFVTRGRGVSIHRTDCVNMVNLPAEERIRLIDAEWSDSARTNEKDYPVEIVIYSFNRSGVLLDISRIFTESKIDVKSMNVRTTKQDKATIIVGFETHGVEQLNRLVKKIRNVESIIDIERRSN